MGVRAERAYDTRKRAKGADEYRVLVDRIWPRGVRKEALDIDDWAKELAPSTDLRKWFGHDPGRWGEFRRRYRRELEDHHERLDAFRKIADSKDLVLLFGAREERYNQARVLEEMLKGR
ncbi:MAG: DUF488 family protein [Chromatiales bacterium]|jgi:uncharacterized protein YeaO (DUF488 family)